MWTSFKTWLRQPTTVAGISAASGTLVGLMMGQIAVSTALPLLVGAVVGMIMPDNTAAKQDVQTLAADLMKGTAPKA